MTRNRAIGLRTIGLLLLVLALVAFWRLPDSGDGDGRPSIRNLSSVDFADVAELPPVDEGLRFFGARVLDNPGDFVSHLRLGDLHQRRARESGDAGAYVDARDAYARAAGLAPGYAAARASLAAAELALHNFSFALEVSEQAFRENPRLIGALAVMGDAHVALGNVDEAEEAYRTLQADAPSAASLARLAHIAELRGGLAEAVDLAERAAQEALLTGSSREGVAWYLFRAGDLYFDTGRLDQAAGYHEAALRAFPGFHVALAGLGEVRAAQGRYEEAAELYARVEAIANDGPVNRRLYRRELASFYADHGLKPALAVRLARGDLDVRQDVHGYDTLAWTLYGAGSYAEAADAMNLALSLGTQDANFFYHAGIIQLALGKDEAAARWLERALELNPYFGVPQAEQARTTLAGLE